MNTTVSDKQDSPVILVNNLTKVYGRELSIVNKKMGRRIVGVNNSSFTVKKGEIFGFLGPNGAGKTTTIRSILGYLHIQEGKISVFGLDYKHEYLKIRKNIGYLPSDMALYGNFTGNELLKYYGKFRPIDEVFLDELKTQFKVDLTLKIKSMSTGNKKQVGLLLALSSRPSLLILDEPTTGLDPLMSSRFHKIIKNLKKQGITIFLSSHDLSEVQNVCDRVGIIKEGKMILVENVDALKNKFMQHIKVSFKNGSIPNEEDFKGISSVISVTKENSVTFVLQVKEDINELMKFITKFSINRISIQDVSLEDIFLQYYQ